MMGGGGGAGLLRGQVEGGRAVSAQRNGWDELGFEELTLFQK